METVHQSTEVQQQPALFGTKRARLVVAALAAVLVAVGIALVFTLGGTSKTSTESVVATLRVPGHPGWVTAGEDAMWVSLNCDVGGPVRPGDSSGSISRQGQSRRPSHFRASRASPPAPATL